jgi:glycosyltransferase involved in cell wall biosynthesis
MIKIVANMVGRNESNSYLDRVLARVATQVDLITFTDDGSTDETPDIALKHGAKVLRCPEPLFTKHEGALRQKSWDFLESQITPNDNWYVLAIDCDEMLYETKFEIHDLIWEHRDHDVFNIMFYHMWNENQYRTDKAWRPHGSTRLFKYLPNGKFQDRQLACGSEPTYVIRLVRSGALLNDTGLNMKHLSYIKDEDKQAKYKRYAAIDGGAFHANAHIESILDEEPVLREWNWSGGGPE